ncbi:ABC transporter substrate-binding protein [Pseudomonas syringae]|uniref:ABC transporter substrate-binding protein n=1 Tax=Pseudomonas syringae TaxID=317 RepID=A0A0L1LSX9_PSESX|nr:ABC transporter substrate-binding protein [Pseudomonas syringae]
MNSEEQTLIDGLFSRLQQAETDSAPRDAQAEARIKEHLTRQPAAGYFMTQAILVQEAAIKSLDEQNKQLTRQVQQLQAELQSAKTQTAAPATTGGGFLSSIFGGGSRDPQPAPTQSAAPSNGGWREPGRPSFNAQPPQQNFGAAPQPNNAPQQAAGSGFLGGALKTAAGVAGGVMLAQGISSLFQHNQQPEVVEVIKEEPAQVNDQSGDNGSGEDQRVVDNSYDQGGFTDADYSDDSSSFFGGDDDSFV